MAKPAQKHSLWDLTVLCFLREGPMHPYELQRLVHERHTDQVLVLKRGSLYHAVNRLHRARLIEPVETTREGHRPERTVYRLTEAGEQEMLRWLRELIAVPQRETPAFAASVSFLLQLSPEDAAAQLSARAAALEAEVAQSNAVLELLVPRIGRITLLEVEHARALRQAELEWVRGLIADLRSGRLSWDTESLLAQVRAARAQSEGEKESQT
jgi:DNA-binding PadR family transcriptional regulator